MTNPTLKRAARALWFERGGSWSDASDRQKQQCIYEARAVLMAVRIPSDKVGGPVDVGYETMRHREVTTHRDARVCFTAMIDAILNDGEGE